MIATSTLALRTGFIARWIAFLGYAVALLLLFASRNIEGILLAFPLWVLLVSLHILVGNLREPPRTSVSNRRRRTMTDALWHRLHTSALAASPMSRQRPATPRATAARW